MKILDVKPLIIPEVKVVRFARFHDERGFFTEIYRKSDFDTNPQTLFLKNQDFLQANVSFSKKGVVRGLHFQWDPPMDKLVRVVAGRMIDLALDIRKSSPTFGKIIGYDMDVNQDEDYNEWIWIPRGFAHGSLYPEETFIEYFCTAEWNPNGETSISPFADDIDWSLCDDKLKNIFDELRSTSLVTEKDKHGFTINEWSKSVNSDKFTFEQSS